MRNVGARTVAQAAVILFGLALAASAGGQTAQPVSTADTPESVVTALYTLVTFETGKSVDWEKVKGLFIPEAVVVLRTSRTAMSVFSRQGFVDDFVNFIKQSKLEDKAFEEKILAMKAQTIGDMARCLVLYAAHIPGTPRAPQQGIDSFLLMKRDGQWRIVAVTNEIVRPDVPVPEELRK